MHSTKENRIQFWKQSHVFFDPPQDLLSIRAYFCGRLFHIKMTFMTPHVPQKYAMNEKSAIFPNYYDT